LFANFIYKQGNSQNEVGIHQDWTYVDENIYNSVNVWLPLCNTDWQNGGLFLLPKSHKIDFHIRSTPFEDIFEKYKNKIHEKSISIQTKLGQAVIYDSRLIHFSTPNYTPNYRVACACIFIPNESTPLHFYKEKEIIYKYEVESAFYINYDPFKKPLNNPQGFILKKSLVNNTPIIEFLKKL
jgi:ectoine hydroxylase-related dioxygenase (phytanoyl-CoA dioxygenase family)